MLKEEEEAVGSKFLPLQHRLVGLLVTYRTQLGLLLDVCILLSRHLVSRAYADSLSQARGFALNVLLSCSASFSGPCNADVCPPCLVQKDKASEADVNISHLQGEMLLLGREFATIQQDGVPQSPFVAVNRCGAPEMERIPIANSRRCLTEARFHVAASKRTLTHIGIHRLGANCCTRQQDSRKFSRTQTARFTRILTRRSVYMPPINRRSRKPLLLLPTTFPVPRSASPSLPFFPRPHALSLLPCCPFLRHPFYCCIVH